MEPVLIVGLDEDRARRLQWCFGQEGFRADVAGGEEQARALLAARQYRVLVCKAEADRALAWVAAEPSPVATVLLAHTNGPDGEWKALARGAADVVALSASNEEVVLRARRAADRAVLLRSYGVWREAERSAYCCDLREGRDEVMLLALDQAQRAAAGDDPVLLSGEPGSGRESLARYIHQRSSERPGAFAVAECAHDPGAVETRLFGCGAAPDGAGLLELACGGTLFLTEVSALAPGVQLRLAELLVTGYFTHVGQTRRIWSDVRLIAATSANLPKLVQAGRFRPDLAERFADCQIEVPPLRRRPRAIERLARHFLERARRKLRRPMLFIEPEALQAMQEYSWPGNVSELEAVVFRAAVLCDGSVRRRDLQLPRGGSSFEATAANGALSWREIERKAIEDALARFAGNRTHAARALGISLRKLQYRLRAYGMTRNGLA